MKDFQIHLKFKSWLYLIICASCIQWTNSIKFKPSPCPAKFNYESTTNDDRWYGDITFPVNTTIEGSAIRIELDRPSELLSTTAGPITSKDNQVYFITHEDIVLEKGSTYKFIFMIKFRKGNEIPMLETIHFNGQRICPPDLVTLSLGGGNDFSSARPDIKATAPTDVISDIDKKPKNPTRATTRATYINNNNGDNTDYYTESSNINRLTTSRTPNSNFGGSNSGNQGNSGYNPGNSNNFGGGSSNGNQGNSGYNPGNSNNFGGGSSNGNQGNSGYNPSTSDNFGGGSNSGNQGNSGYNPTSSNFGGSSNNGNQGNSGYNPSTSSNSGSNSNGFNSNSNSNQGNNGFGGTSNSNNFGNNGGSSGNNGFNSENPDTFGGSSSNLGSNSNSNQQNGGFNSGNSNTFGTNGNMNQGNNGFSNVGGNGNSNQGSSGNQGGVIFNNGGSTNSQGNKNPNQGGVIFNNGGSSNNGFTQRPVGNEATVSSQVACGSVSIANPLITLAQNSEYGQWPWHVALFMRDEGNPSKSSYICGGSLVSKNKVITAAHCVSLTGNRIVNPNSLTAYMGKYNINTEESTSQKRTISSFKVNPEYNKANFHNDIAILSLNEDVEYTSYVRPVCLWEAAEGIQDVVGKNGYVVGWGYNEYQQLNQELKQATMPIVSAEKCVRSDPQFFSEYVSDNAFCAGALNGTGPCKGDSGGGLVLKRNNSWYLRGIVSVSAAPKNGSVCNNHHYIVFTDTAKYNDFIKRNIS